MAPILTFADAHLTDSHRFHDSAYALEQIAVLAEKYRVAAVISAGDLMDSVRSGPRPVHALHRFLDRLDDLAIPFRYVDGNHDFSQVAWPASHRHASSLHRCGSFLGGLHVYGLNFQPALRLQEELDQVPKSVDLLVTHQLWSDWAGSVCAPQGSFADVPHVPALVSGDYHQCRVHDAFGKDGQRMAVASPGATHLCAINEPAEHFVVLFERGRFEKVALKSRPVVQLGPLIQSEDVDKLLDGDLEAELGAAITQAHAMGLPAELQRPYLRITYAYTLSDVVRRVERVLNKRAILFWNEIPPDREVSEQRAVILERAAGGAVTPLTLLPDYVDELQDPDTFGLVSALLSATSGAQEAALAEWRTKYMGAAAPAEAEVA